MVTDDEGGRGSGDFVVVPPTPGALLRPTQGRTRPRDDLDDVIDELVPDVAEGPGWFDAALAVVGVALLVGGFATASGALLAFGAIAFVLGLVLPARSAWRRARDLRTERSHASLRERGTVLDRSTAGTARLVDAYDAVSAVAPHVDPDLAGTARAAAHAALLEVAGLLEGRPPRTARETAYVERRATAIADLVDRLAATSQPGPEPPTDATADLRLDAMEQLDALGGGTSLDRLAELGADPRITRRDPG